jgi:hypothetical protein
MYPAELRDELLAKLLSFSGSPQRWKDQTPFGEIVLSEGCKFLREKEEFKWLFDLINSHQSRLKNEEFQEWITTRISDNEFIVTCTDGDDQTFATQKIQYSALPLDTLKIWLVEGVYLLPSEY